MKARVTCNGELLSVSKDFPDDLTVGTKIDWELAKGTTRIPVKAYVKTISTKASAEGLVPEVEIIIDFDSLELDYSNVLEQAKASGILDSKGLPAGSFKALAATSQSGPTKEQIEDLIEIQRLASIGKEFLEKWPGGLAEVEAAIASRNSNKEFITLPRNPSRIMALRGLQGNRVVKDDEFDLACDYMQIDTKRMPHVKGFDEGDIWVTLDEREFLVIASIYRGCIQGYEEWERLRAKEPDHGNLPYWDTPVTTPNPEDLTYSTNLE